MAHRRATSTRRQTGICSRAGILGAWALLGLATPSCDCRGVRLAGIADAADVPAPDIDSADDVPDAEAADASVPESEAGDGCGRGGTPSCPSELGGPCNVVLQCGCLVRERCVVGPESVEACVPAGFDPIGTECPPSGDNCAPQMQCLGFDATHSYCMQFCYEHEDCPDTARCDYGTPWCGYRVCEQGEWCFCDPFTGAGCAGGESCSLDPVIEDCLCEPAGDRAPGETCGPDDGACELGAGCFLADTTGDTVPDPPGRCRSYCSLSGGAHRCPVGESCTALFHPSVGICMPDSGP